MAVTKKDNKKASSPKAQPKKSGKTIKKKSNKPAPRGQSGKRSVKAKVPEKNPLNYEIVGIVWLAAAAFCLLCLFVDSMGYVGEFVQKILFTLTGQGRLLLPFVFGLTGYYFIKEKTDLKVGSKLWGFSLFFLSILGLLHCNVPLADSFKVALAGEPVGGGLFGAAFSFLLLKLFGQAGSYIILGAILIISLVLITGYTVKQQALSMVSSIRLVLSKLPQIKRKKKNGKTTTKEQHTADEQEDNLLLGAGSVSAAANDYLDHEKQQMRTQAEAQWQEAMRSGQNPETTEVAVFVEPGQQVSSKNKTKKISEADYPETAADGEQQEFPFDPDAETPVGYLMPPLELLHKPVQVKNVRINKNITDNTQKVEETLQSFGINAKVVHVDCGPSITRYEIQPPEGVKVSKIVNLADNLALKLAASNIRIEAPIPGKAVIGVEVPNKDVAMVHLRELLESSQFINAASRLSVALGKDIGGKPVIIDLAKMPHLLIAGATGAGKSVCVNALIASILYKAKPNEVKILLIDPKRVELTCYNGIPHLLQPVVTNPKKAAVALRWAVKEMTERYAGFERYGVRDIASYNQLAARGETEGGQVLPQIVIMIDELSDLMMAAPKEVEESICRLAQLARAAGMHLIIATQRPSVDVITGLIKANIPSRISFAVSSQIDSRTILDMSGAEKLLGRGDMLYFPIGAAKPVRIQGPYLSDREIDNLVAFLKGQKEPEPEKDTVLPEDFEAVDGDEQAEEEDRLFLDALKQVAETGQVSVSFLQRKLQIGYNRSARIVDSMEQKGYVGKYKGGKREVNLTKEQFEELLKNYH